jgi:hypothetical protein
MVRIAREPRIGVEDHFPHAVLGVGTADGSEQRKGSVFLADAVLAAWE